MYHKSYLNKNIVLDIALFWVFKEPLHVPLCKSNMQYFSTWDNTVHIPSITEEKQKLSLLKLCKARLSNLARLWSKETFFFVKLMEKGIAVEQLKAVSERKL